MTERYFIDERVGCMAVRDRQNTDPEYNGLHDDTPGVVKYWYGTLTQTPCPRCHKIMSSDWDITEESRQEAKDLCHKMNEVLDL